ncbi:hypothetical protein B0H13DRAFT_2349424 [Mycena leptocephala]|nr:hypothetical protein B0H13DRAFT_2349424 [Mycena leptocephala]
MRGKIRGGLPDARALTKLLGAHIADRWRECESSFVGLLAHSTTSAMPSCEASLCPPCHSHLWMMILDGGLRRAALKRDVVRACRVIRDTSDMRPDSALVYEHLCAMSIAQEYDVRCSQGECQRDSSLPETRIYARAPSQMSFSYAPARPHLMRIGLRSRIDETVGSESLDYGSAPSRRLDTTTALPSIAPTLLASYAYIAIERSTTRCTTSTCASPPTARVPPLAHDVQTRVRKDAKDGGGVCGYCARMNGNKERCLGDSSSPPAADAGGFVRSSSVSSSPLEAKIPRSRRRQRKLLWAHLPHRQYVRLVVVPIVIPPFVLVLAPHPQPHLRQHPKLLQDMGPVGARWGSAGRRCVSERRLGQSIQTHARSGTEAGALCAWRADSGIEVEIDVGEVEPHAEEHPWPRRRSSSLYAHRRILVAASRLTRIHLICLHLPAIRILIPLPTNSSLLSFLPFPSFTSSMYPFSPPRAMKPRSTGNVLASGGWAMSAPTPVLHVAPPAPAPLSRPRPPPRLQCSPVRANFEQRCRQAHTHTHAQVHGLDFGAQGEECSRGVDIGAQGEGKDGREERGGAAVPPDAQS